MQQTLKFHIDHITANTDDITDDFVPTNFDVSINEFMEACLDDYQIPVSKSFVVVEKEILCIIDYREMTAAEKQDYDKYKAGKAGIITNIKDITFNT